MTQPQADAPPLITFLRWTVRNPGSPERGVLAALRRGAGREPGSVPEMYPIVEPRLRRDAPRWEVEAAYLVAGIFALHPVDWAGSEASPGEGHNRTFGASLRRVRWRDESHTAENEDKGIERRFVALLDARRQDLAAHLRGLVNLMRSRDESVLVDYTRLLRDLEQWDSPERWVQRRWADGFWRGSASEGAAVTGDAADTTNDDDDD